MKNIKVKVFCNSNIIGLQNSINDFLAGLKSDVLDIKFSSCETTFETLVIYKEDTKGE